MARLLFFLFLLIFLVSATAEATQVRVLTLHDAIFLAIRENPNVKQIQLQHILQKYALDLAHWQFKPHYALSATQKTSRNFSVNDSGYVSENSSGVQGEVSLLTPIGTVATLTPMVSRLDHQYRPSLSLQISQPLIRGFGRAIVEAELYNAIDNEKISRLNVEGTLRNTVTQVINAYLDVISAQKNLDVAEKALIRAEQSVSQTRLFIKAGHKAGVELVTVDAEVASAKTQIEMAKNNLTQSRYALLEAIGLNPNTPVTLTGIEVTSLIKKYHVPNLIESKQLSLQNDIQYQIDQITIRGATKRSLINAEDQTRWDLNLTANASIDRATDDDHEFDHWINGVDQTNSLSLKLTIPLDDRSAKTAVINAKIALKEAHIALQQEEWRKETVTINGWNNIYSEERSLHFAENAEQLQAKTWEISFQKYTHGLIDSLQLQTAQQQLISSQQALNASRINYLKALVNFDQMIGRTLQTWQVQVRYGEQ